MGIGVGAAVRLQHRLARLLELQEQGISPARHHQNDPTHCAHAAYPHHFEGDIHHLEAVEQHVYSQVHVLLVFFQGMHGNLQEFLVPYVTIVVDQRRLVDDAGRVTGAEGQFGKLLLVSALLRRFGQLLGIKALDSPYRACSR